MFLSHFIDYQFRRNLKHLIVHVTNHCNFRCKHCFIDFSPKRDLTLERYQQLAKEVGKLFWLDFGGGEPYSRKDLVEIVCSFDAEVITIPTNGYFTERIVDYTKAIQKKTKAEVTVALSVDGLQPMHDNIRQKGSWDKLWATFDRLKTINGIRTKINTVLCKENFNDILSLMTMVEKKKPDFHSIILLRGNPIDPTFGLPPLIELKKIQPEIFKLWAKYDYGHSSIKSRILRNYHRYLWNTSLKTLQERTQVSPCLSGKAHAVVMGNGDVLPCEMLPAIGNIQKNSWQEIWNSDALKKQVKSIENKECFCTHNCAMLDSILFRPQSYIPLLTGGNPKEHSTTHENKDASVDLKARLPDM